MELSPSGRFRLEILAFALVMLSLTGAALQLGWFRALDRFVYDLLLPLAAPALDERLLIVGIDEQSLAERGPWPWDRRLQADLLERLAAAGPAAVFVDVVHAGATEPAADAALVAAAAEVPGLALPLMVDFMASGQQLIEVLPFADLVDQAESLGHIHVELDADAIARGTFLFQGIGEPVWPHLMLDLADYVAPHGAVGLTREQFGCAAADGFSMANQRCGYVRFPFVGPPNSIPAISANQVLNDVVPAHSLRGRILLLGLTAAGVDDAVTVPVSGGSRPMSGVELNANLLNALLQERLIQQAPAGWVWALTLLAVAVPVFRLPRTTPKSMLLLTLVAGIVPLLVTALALLVLRWDLPLAAGAVLALACYPVWSWRRQEMAFGFIETEMRRLEEERHRWRGMDAVEVSPGDPVRLARLLHAELVTSEESVPFYLNFSQPGAETLLLARDKPFSEAERKLVQRQLRSAEAPPPPALPGENLAARIRLLQDQAEAVRLGRDIGLRGLERMPSGVCVVSPLGRILFANSAFADFTSADTELDPDLFDAVRQIRPPLGRNWLEIARAVVLEGEPTDFETRLADDRMVYVSAAPLDETGNWLLTLVDMTQVREAERHREEALAFLSHDLRSPMLSILALVRQSVPGSLLGQIGSYANRGLAASEQFLQLSRVQTSEQFETFELDLLSVVDNALDQVHALARDKGIMLDSLDLDAYEEGIWIEGNGELLERAFENLLSNAVKYSHRDARVQVRVAELEEDWVAVAVRDEGIGIAPEDLGRIFDPYFRASGAGYRERGAGLGLRFVKTVVERHGGRVRVDSVLGQGSNFTVWLPRLAAGEGVAADGAGRTSAAAGISGGTTDS